MSDNTNEEVDLFDLFRDEFRPVAKKDPKVIETVEELKQAVQSETVKILTDFLGEEEKEVTAHEPIPEDSDKANVLVDPRISGSGDAIHQGNPDVSGNGSSNPSDHNDDDLGALFGRIGDESEDIPVGTIVAPMDVDPYSEENKEKLIAELRRKLMGEPMITREEIDKNLSDNGFPVETEDNFIDDEKEFVDDDDHQFIIDGEDELLYVSADLFEDDSDADDSDASGEEVLTGTVVDIYTPVLEGNIVTTSKDTVSALQKAMNRLAELENVDREFDEETTAMRVAINETQKLLDKLKSDYARKMDERHSHKRKVADAQTEVSEEAHKEAERQREEEIKKQRKEAMRSFHRDIEELDPEWFGYAFDHQWEGAATLALHGSGLLADEMGLGKTLSAIMWLDMVKGKRNLIITPNDTNSNFTLEVAMWARHRFTYTLAGADKAGRHVMWDMVLKPRVDSGEDLTLAINYEQLYTDADYFDKLMSVEWDTIIIDEAHNFKKQSSLLFNRIKALKQSKTNKDESSPDFGKSTVKILPMTGTFILNKPEDIWPALHLIDEDAFPTIKQFRDFYCEYNYYNSAWEFRTGGERSLLIALGGRIVKRNMAEAGIVLPEQHIHHVDIEFDDNYYDQRRIMRQLAEHSQIILDSERKVSIVEQIALITRQRQAAVLPAGIVIKDPMTGEVVFSVGEEVRESIKVDWAVNKIMELRQPSAEFPQGERIAVFSQFKTALAEMETQLMMRGIKVVRYDGDTDNATKMLVKRDFDRKHVEKMSAKNGDLGYQFEVVLCNYKTGGVGLNFTHATELIEMDREWNPGKESQAYARTNRIGQTQENHVWIPELKGSVDEWMSSLIERKRDLIAGFDNEVDLQKEFSDFLSTVKDI